MSLLFDRDRVVGRKSGAMDAAPFKVGDLVRMSEGGLTGKITKIEPNGHFRVSFLYNKANGFSQSFSANEIVMVKPAKDAAEAGDAEQFNVGDRVKDVRTGRTGEIILDNTASLSFTVRWDNAGQTNVPKGYGYLVAADETESGACDSLPTVGGYITLKSDGKKYKILKDWGGGEYIVADPKGGDFQVKYSDHLEGLKHYGKDAADFKVGDKVRIKHNALPTVYVIEKITDRGTVYLAVKGHESYKEATSLNDLVAAKEKVQDAIRKFR